MAYRYGSTLRHLCVWRWSSFSRAVFSKCFSLHSYSSYQLYKLQQSSPRPRSTLLLILRNTLTIFILGAQITMEVSINNFKLTFLVRLQLFWLLLTRWSHGEGQCEYCVRSIDTQSHTNFKPCSSYQQRQPSSRYSLRKVSGYNQ